MAGGEFCASSYPDLASQSQCRRYRGEETVVAKYLTSAKRNTVRRGRSMSYNLLRVKQIDETRQPETHHKISTAPNASAGMGVVVIQKSSER